MNRCVCVCVKEMYRKGSVGKHIQFAKLRAYHRSTSLHPHLRLDCARPSQLSMYDHRASIWGYIQSFQCLRQDQLYHQV